MSVSVGDVVLSNNKQRYLSLPSPQRTRIKIKKKKRSFLGVHTTTAKLTCIRLRDLLFVRFLSYSGHPLVVTGRDLIADAAEEILQQSSVVNDLAVYLAVERGGSTSDSADPEGFHGVPEGFTEVGKQGHSDEGTVWRWDFRRGATAGLKAAGGARSFDKVVHQ
jgi:hypothetical protein